MQWIVAINDAGPSFPQYAEMAKVAIYTALERTLLKPYVIYDGRDNEFTRWLQRHGVRIIPWRSSLYHEVRALGSRQPNKGFIGALPGIFLRVDLPLIGERFGLDEYVLYTDCDVMFIDDVVDMLEPLQCRYFAVAAESNRPGETDPNTGVMWMHLPEMLKRQADFVEFILERIDQLPGYSWDQGAYSRFYRSADGVPLWEQLPFELNWRPYWEHSPATRLIHFHGPKPFHQSYIATLLPELRPLTGACFNQLCTIWRDRLAEANARPASGRGWLDLMRRWRCRRQKATRRRSCET